MKKLNVDIPGICEVKWKKESNSWSGEYSFKQRITNKNIERI